MKRTQLSFLLILTLLFSAPLSAQNWPSFRGQGATGVSDYQGLPTEWDLSSGKNVLWKTVIPGMSHASPIIWENRAIVISVTGEANPELLLGKRGGSDLAEDLTPHSWRIYCLDTGTGEIVWQKEAYSGVPRAKRHGKASHANSTPATDGKTIAAIFGSQGIMAFDFEGNVKWKADLGVLDPGLRRDPSISWGHGSSPIIEDGKVFVQVDRHSNSYLVAFDAETGKEAWRVERDEMPVWATPLLHRGALGDELIVAGGHYNRAYNPRNGREIWQLKDDAEVKIPTPFVSEGLIILAGGFRGRPVIAVKPGAKGDISIPEDAKSGPFVQWKSQPLGPYTVTPLAYRGLLYIVRDAGILQVHDLQTGEMIFRDRTDATQSASPVASDGHLYLTTEEGEILVYSAGREPELVARNDMGEACMSTPAISQGTLFIRTNGHLVAVGR